jgi:hypothetical protein
MTRTVALTVMPLLIAFALVRSESRDQYPRPSHAIVSISIPEGMTREQVSQGGESTMRTLVESLRMALRRDQNMTGADWADLIVVVVDTDGTPILPDHDRAIGPRNRRASGQELHFTFSSSAQPWRPDELTLLSQWIADFYPVIKSIYGPPAFDITVNIRKDTTVAGISGMYFLSSNELIVTTLAADVVCHEIIHAFHDDYIIGLASHEEGMTRAAEVEVFNMLDAYTHWDECHSLPMDYQYEAVNKPTLGTMNGNIYAGTTRMLIRYALSSYAWAKPFLEQSSFFRTYNAALYAASISDPSVLGQEARLIQILAQCKPTIEGLPTETWYHQQQILNSTPPTGYQLLLRYNNLGETMLEFFLRDAGGGENQQPGVSFTWAATSWSGSLADSGSGITNSFGWSSDVLPRISAGYQGRVLLTAQVGPAYGSLRDSLYQYFGPSQGLYGVAKVASEGTITITPLDTSLAAVTVPVTNGGFAVPHFRDVRSRFQLDFVTSYGRWVSRIITKDRSDYFVLLDDANGISPPVISRFTPEAGPVETLMDIRGYYFDPVPDHNLVWFGGVRGTVITATPERLFVRIPPVATTCPITVTSHGLTGYALTPFRLTFPGAREIRDASFSPKTDFVTRTNTEGFATADIDCDGKPDLVVVNNGANSISLFRNTSGKGAFSSTSLAAGVEFAVGARPNAIAIGDLNGDGRQDVVITNSQSGTISILENMSVAGVIDQQSLGTRVDLDAGLSPRSVAIGDIDGDGWQDIVVTRSGDNTFIVLRNVGRSAHIGRTSFTPGPPFATGNQPESVALGDFFRDRRPDVVIANAADNTVAVYINLGHAGGIDSTTFRRPSYFATGKHPHTVRVADMDGDGLADILTADFSDNAISILRNTNSHAWPEAFFAPRVDYATGTGPYGLDVGDLDGDGKYDVAVVHFSQANEGIVFRNVGTRAEIDSSSFVLSAHFVTGDSPIGVIISDVDGDARGDLAVFNLAGHSISLLRNLLQPGPGIATVVPVGGPVGTNVAITGSNFNPQPVNNIVRFGGVQATVRSATATVLHVLVPPAATYGPISVTTNGLTGYWTHPFDVTFANAGRIDSMALVSAFDLHAQTIAASIAMGDLNGDGFNDVVIANRDSAIITVSQNGLNGGPPWDLKFLSPVDFPIGGRGTSLALADLDRDGALDIVVASAIGGTVTVLRNTAGGNDISSTTFEPAVVLHVGGDPRGVGVNDIDGDGRPDIVIAKRDSNQISVLANIGPQGSIDRSSFAPEVSFGPVRGAQAVAISDLDGDGKVDVAVSGSGVKVLRNTSSPWVLDAGSFAPAVQCELPGPQYTSSVACADVDGDGKPDVIVGWEYSVSGIAVLRNTSTVGSLTPSSFEHSVSFSTGTYSKGVAFADVDGDGCPDAVVACNLVAVLRNTSTQQGPPSALFGPAVTWGRPGRGTAVAAGDMDGDGRPDLVVGHFDNQTVTVLRNMVVPPPGRVDLQYPVNDANLSADTVKCQWRAGGPEVSHYWVEYSTDSAFTVSAIDSVVPDTTRIFRHLELQRRYWWRVRANNAAGWGNFSTVRRFTVLATDVAEANALPTDYDMSQNYPNPFNSSTTIVYQLPVATHARLLVYDLLGREVAAPVNEQKEPGCYEVRFDASHLSSGVYVYRLTMDQAIRTRKMLVLK